MLRGWLDLYRDIMVYKIEGLDEDQARFRPAPDAISLLNLIVHLTGVERRWFEHVIAGRTIERDRAAEFSEIGITVVDAIAAYREQWRRSDEVFESVGSLDDACPGESGYTVRWVLHHMLEETARHAGHADITRQLIDGSVGYSRLERD
jgi:hypothetical protein